MKAPTWPTPQEYNEAIQNPRTCFDDVELRGGSPTLTPLGLPKPISGAFASVYEVACGDRRWAVRCFLREYADQRSRYAAIGDHLRAAALPFMVAFEYLERGILVAGCWRPILKMEWIDGEPLNVYLAQHLDDPEHLRDLARQWIALAADLRRAGIAHGDLQHGNILVSNGTLRLIDYDGMFVPALAGLPSREEGHRNFQHPARTGRDFDTELDNFSTWVILDALLAFAHRPTLWGELGAGDEWLLYRREDFDLPDRSAALRALRESRSPSLRLIAEHFRELLRLDARQIPPLDGVVPPWRRPRPKPKAEAKPAPALPGWLSEQVGAAPPPEAEPAPAADTEPEPEAEPEGGIAGLDAAWLLEQFEPVDPHAWLPPHVALDRGVAGAGVVLATAFAAAGGLGLTVAVTAAGLFVGSAAAASAWLLHRFRTLPGAVARRAAVDEVVRARRALRRAEAATARAARRLRSPGRVERIRGRIRREEHQLELQLEAVRQSTAKAENRLDLRRRAIERLERRRLSKMEAETQAEIDRHNEDRNSVGGRPEHQWTSRARRRKSKLGRSATPQQVLAEIQKDLLTALEERRKRRRAIHEEFAGCREQLDRRAAAAAEKAERQADAVRDRSRARLAGLQVALSEAEKADADRTRRLEAALERLSRESDRAASRLMRAEVGLARYDAIQFLRYAGNLIVPRRAPRPSGGPPGPTPRLALPGPEEDRLAVASTSSVE